MKLYYPADPQVITALRTFINTTVAICGGRLGKSLKKTYAYKCLKIYEDNGSGFISIEPDQGKSITLYWDKNRVYSPVERLANADPEYFGAFKHMVDQTLQIVEERIKKTRTKAILKKMVKTNKDLGKT